MDRTQFLHVRALGLACLSFLVVAGVAGAASRPLDLDQDGLSDQRERSLGTSAQRGDTDGDGLPDGWEESRGLSPTEPDTDGDGVPDGAEVAFGFDPTVPDTDEDGLSDLAEAPAGNAGPDCDGDGIPAPREADDDADGRTDADEPAEQRCDADVDADGVPDGDEGNDACVVATDCDKDGVPDRNETLDGFSFDPLDPDTFDVHLPDSVAYAFAQSGQAPSRDGDSDGIPDSWEGQTGLIDWGAYRPRPGQRDLLIEFVRVVGPDSGRTGRMGDLPLRPAYDRVAAAFAAHGIQLSYVETTVSLPTEPVASSNPSRTSTHYRTVLDQAAYSANPYVVTVVLNPQQDQSQVVHSGVAPLRGMLAAVDVSQFVDFTLKDSTGNLTVTHMTPFWESLILAGRMAETGRTGGQRTEGGSTYDYLVVTGPSGSREVRWTPYWFRAPSIQFDGDNVPLFVTDRFLADADLAHTIMHEIGHTLGLCHTHEAACKAQLPIEDQSRDRESSMSYTSPDDLVAYLPGEWTRVDGYLACPPPMPVRLVAENATRDALLDAKYAYELDPDPENAGRSCADFEPIERSFVAVAESAPYEPPPERTSPPAAHNSPTPTVAYWSGASGAAAFVALTVARWRLRLDGPQHA
jgi:hypothetical protein